VQHFRRKVQRRAVVGMAHKATRQLYEFVLLKSAGWAVKLISSEVAVVRPSVSRLNPVYTIQPVIKPVEQPVGQPAASRKQTYNRLSGSTTGYIV